MAYKQSPGRGNNAKTGYGIPAPFKQVDKEVDLMIARKKTRDEYESKAKSDSTAVDNKLRNAGIGSGLAGYMGNKKANETRATLPEDAGWARVVNKDKTGKYRKGYVTSPAKQVDKEVDEIIARKKASEAKAKNDKATKEGEAARTKSERALRIKLNSENEARAKSDSTAVDKKLRDAGMPASAGYMGNKKGNETRQSGSPYRGSYESVDKDKTGKYKRTIKSQSSPAKMKKSPMKQSMARAAGKAAGMTIGSARKASAAGTVGGAAAKATSTRTGINGMSPGTKGERVDTGLPKRSPAKQLGRQAVTKVAGKKAPAKMKSC